MKLLHALQQVWPIKYSDQVYKHKQFFLQSLVFFSANKGRKQPYHNILMCYFVDLLISNILYCNEM